jgi:two-component system phosphate regulon sensor histidine kinase PhoR
MLVVLTAAGLAGALLVAAGSIGLIRSAVRERFVERVRAETALLAGWAAGIGAGQAQPFALDAAGGLNVRVTLIAADGTVLGDSAKDPEGVARMDNHLERPEVRGARLGFTGDSFRRSNTTHERYFYSARRIEGEFPIKYVRIALPASRVSQVQARYAGLTIAVALATILPLTLLAYGAVRRLSRPLESIADGLERASQGELVSDLPSHGVEEIRRLSAALRRIQSELLARIGELDAERGILASVVSGMQEGLLLLDADRYVRLANDAARSIFDLRFDPVGRTLTEVVRHPTVIRDVEQAMQEGRQIRESPLRMNGSGRSFELHVTPLSGPQGSGPSGALVLLFDVSRLEALERVRREFVANVSHELRTPLTAIRASVESLLEERLPSDVRRFLEIIERNAGHMGDLIEDLTDLSLIETGSVVLHSGAVDVTELARGLAERIGPLARNQGVEIEIDLPARFPIHADRRRLEEMLTNLLDNAIKFNRPGGRVRIHATLREGRPVLFVEDNGVGIPAHSLERVFNRFFQVDRERSRLIRGTGLGLAIVKHLMRLHGGTVQVESELGRGSTFILEFPPPPVDAT